MRKLLVPFFVLLIGLTAFGQQKIQLRSVDKAECVSSDMKMMKASFSFSGVEANDVVNDRGTFSWLSMPNTVLGGNVGEPQVPVINELIAVPFGATPRIEITSYSATDYSLEDFGIHTLVPRQLPVRKSQSPEEMPFVLNEAAYQASGMASEPQASVSVEGTMRGVQLGTMTIEPVCYDPVSNTLRVFNDIEVTVHFDGAEAQATKEMLLNTYSPAFEAVYDQLFNNRALRDAYSEHPDLYNTPVKMLVICYSGFQGNAALNSWLEWKLQKGYYVDIYYTSETGTSASAIASFIKTKYNASVSAGNAYTYLIVIGDTGQVPQYMTKTIDSDIGQCASDLGYASVNFSSSTSNYFPDMYYSRISVENTTHLTNYINKVLTYEKYEMTDGGNYLNNVILVGGWDSNWTPKVAKPTINYGSNYYFKSSNTTYGGFENGNIEATVSTSSTAGYAGSATGTSTTMGNGVYTSINSGVGFLNYTAHGDKQEWYQPKMTAAQVANLTNSGKYFFGVGNCCLTGNFNNTTTTYSPGSAIGTNACFAETMIRVPNAGAVAYIGCSPYSYWYEDFYWAVGAHSYSQGNYPTTSASSTGVYDAMFIDGSWNSASALLYLGNLAVQQAVTNGNSNSSITSGNCTNSAHYYFQFYHTFGDGSVMPYVTKPETNTVTLPSMVTPGTTSITVNALAGSYVAVTDNSSVIYGVAEANSSGVATVNFTNAIPSSGTLYVVVTRQQYQPWFGTITVQGGTQYTITANASPTAGGTVTGGGQYYENTQCTLTATANAHYEFSRWTKNGTEVSTANPYNFTVTGNATYVAQFTALTAHTVTCNATENGTISASPTTAYKGEIVTLTATPATGYFFGAWTVKDANNNPVQVSNNQFTMPDSNVTVSATFVTGYNVTLASVSNGTISASPTYGPAGTTITLTATPASGYSLDSWIVYRTDDLSVSVSVSGNSFTMPSYDVTVAAIFTSTASGDVTIGSTAVNTTGWTLPTHVYYNYSLTQQIYTSAEVGEAGTITAISFYYLGSSTSGSASSSGSRTFKIYMSNTTSSSLSSSFINESTSHLVYSGTQTFNSVGWYSFTLNTPFEYDGTSNLLLTFDDNTGSYSVSARRYFRTYSTGAERARYVCYDDGDLDPINATSITSSAAYNTAATDNNIIKLVKTVAATNEAIVVSPDALTGFTYPEGEGPSGAQTIDVIGRHLQSNITVTAPTHYEVCTTAAGTYSSTLSLTPSNGNVQTLVYVRLKSDLSEGNYNNETLTFTSGAATQNVTLSGTVTEGNGTYYNITVTADPETGGTVTGAGRYEEGAQVTLTATPATGYSFINWTKDNTTVSSNTTISFNATENAAYVAHFSRNSYMIQASANPTEGGTVTGAGSYYEGTPVNLVATANTGYTFINWTSNGNVVSTEPSFTFNVTAGGSYVANFEEIESHTVTVSQAEGGTITANPTTAYAGDLITLTVTTENGYYFVEWNVVGANNQSITVNADNTFTMPDSDVTVSANLSQGFIISLSQTDHGTVFADKANAQPGETITLTATPDTDCIFEAWYVYKTGDTRVTLAVLNNQFTMPAYDVTVMGIFVPTVEEEVEIGSGSSTDQYLPTRVRSKYSLSEQIYTADEIGTQGTITAIAFKASTASVSRTLTVYMKPTTKTAFSSATDWETMGSGFKVFQGTVNFNTSGWTTITLDTPFEYDGVKNLNVCVVDNSNSTSGSTWSYTKFAVYSTGAKRALYVYGNSSYANTVGYTSNLSNTSGTQSTSNNQITFTMTVPGSAESLTVAPNVLSGFNYEEGNGPSDMRKLDIIGVDLSDNVTLTAPQDFEICATASGTFGSTLTIERESAKSRSVTNWDFEGDFLDWTTIDKDGDGYNWVVSSELMTSSTPSHSGSNGLTSQSYYKDSKGALTPDNWLISPQVTLGGIFSMWACAQDASWPAEHFGIFVSTTSNTNTDSFTLLNEWTLGAKGGAKAGESPRGTRETGDWYEFTVDLSAYANQTGYIAVRHYNCTDMFYINVDDFKLNTDATYTPDLPVTLTTATVFVRMKGNLEVGEYSGTLAATEGDITNNVSLSGQVLPATATQTMNLVEGWNWWVPTIETTAEAVQDVLSRRLESILSQDGTPTGTLVPGKMYKLLLRSACEAEVISGYIPATLAVTVNNGFNWIGYTGTQATAIGTALSGLNPVEGDKVISQDGGFAIYNGSAWEGTLTTLQPGQGYEYLSRDSGAKTVTF